MTRLLGVVAWVNEDRPGSPIAGVRPLMDASWSPVRAEEFPTQGQAFWAVAENARKDGLVFFGVEENAGKDKFRVVDPEVAYEILDLRYLGDADQVGRVAALGLRRPQPPAAEVLLWCKGDINAGPVRLILGPNGLLTIERAVRERVPYCSASGMDMRDVRLGRADSLVLATLLPAEEGYLDWDDDRYIVQRALSGSLSRTRFNTADIALASRLVEEGLATLEATGDVIEVALEERRLQRAHKLLADHERLDLVSREFMESVQVHPEVQKRIQAVIRTEEQAVRLETAEKLSHENEKLAHLNDEIARRRHELDVLQVELERSRETRDQELEDVARLTRDRLKGVLGSPIALEAEASIYRSVTGAREHNAEGPVRAARRSIHLPWSLGPDPLSDFSALRKRLALSFKAAGIATANFQQIHAALMARLAPILSGPDALGAIEAYAKVVSAGRVVVVHSSALVIEPGDIFGRVGKDGSFVPHPAGLGDLLRAASTSNGLVLAVLEGVNRGPTESFLVPLLRAWSRGGTISICHPNALADGDPDDLVSKAEWPSNVLLVCTLVDGATTLPVSADVWSHGVLVDVQVNAKEEGADSDVSEVDPSSDLFALSEEDVDVFL